MKRFITFYILFFGIFLTAKANHITGGQMRYTFVGMSGTQYEYAFTLQLYMRCNSGRVFPNPIIISVFNRGTFERVTDLSVLLGNQSTISLSGSDPCISNPPQVCYEVAVYHFNLTLPSSPEGYIVSSSVNFRINGITNIGSNSSSVGATYTAEIPGTDNSPDAPQNNSAAFTGNDLVVVCAGNSIGYSFGAQDPDGDELRYYFCGAYNSGSVQDDGSLIPINPPYPEVPYSFPNFSGGSPMGSGVIIDPGTGQISGIAPGPGLYVVTVCVEEIRDGQVIAIQRKDLQIAIADCNIAGANLQAVYMLCKNTQSITIVNGSNSPLIVSYEWQVFDVNATLIHTASTNDLSYTFADTGTYSVKLVINRGQACSDSAIALVKVYPGFVPGFRTTGICASALTTFFDESRTVYGTVNTWLWDFGDLTTTTDVSQLQNPVYSYPVLGPKNVRLIVGTSKGCLDTLTKAVNVIDKPPLNLAFKDTMICVNDALQLRANSPGLFTWSPLVNIINANTATPTVTPTSTITYYVDLDDNGCKNRDSVKVRVVDHVTLIAMNDTTICQNDPIQLRIISDGLRYAWTPAGNLNNASIQSPTAVTSTLTTYQVLATIGSCFANEEIRVTPIPYPTAYAGRDTTICYNTTANLKASTDGSHWRWLPANFLNNSTVLNPIASPPRTTQFIFQAFDDEGCPKPGSDTVIVTVYPKIQAFAGRDTAVIVGQPLQFNASGGNNYTWVPSTHLSSSTIANPVGVFPTISGGLKYKVLIQVGTGCVDSAFIMVRVFKSGPSVYVPTAFTPNGDGRNEVLKPIPVGMKSIDYFKVYNRWGQLIFSSAFSAEGWDGRISGEVQQTGTYIWLLKATDYTGKAYFQKGVFTLIR